MPNDSDATAWRDFARALAERYADLSPLSGGGMSELFVARERRLDRRVVIKRIARQFAGADGRERFDREIAVLATLQHPNIVPLLHADAFEGAPYFVMPFVRGESLRDRLLRGPLSVREAVAILEDVAQALEVAHALGVVHRDIKPGNILLTGSSAMVADFGIAKALARAPGGGAQVLRTPSDLTIEGLSLGTPRYMSPEQFAADPSADHRVDLYALGVVAYEMLAGAPPFEAATTAELARAHLAKTPVPLTQRRREVPPALASLVAACLEKDPEARPRSAAAVLRALRSPSLLQPSAADEATPRRHLTPAPLRSVLQDLRYAVRSLAKTPVLLAATLGCLALGVGSTAAVFSVVDGALLRPLPFVEPERLVSVFRTVGGYSGDPISVPNFLDLREDPVLDRLEAIAITSRIAHLGDRGEPASALQLSGSAFTTLQVRPALGRLFTDDDDRESAPAVVVLSDGFWRSHLGGSPGVVGTTLRLDGVPHDIIGVLPPGFRIPHAWAMLEADVWLPSRFTANQRAQRSSNFLRAFARLAPGQTLESAELALRTRYDGLIEQFPELRGTQVRLGAMQAESQASVRTPLLLLLAAAIAVLAIATINVSSLLLARGIRRQQELAVRTALGATRWQLLRPVLAESAVIAVGGCTIGLALAALAVRTIGLLAAQQIPQLAGASLDARTVLAAIALALLAATMGSLAPALRALRLHPGDALRGGRGSEAAGQHRALGVLVIAEGALALALLVAAGLVFKGYHQLQRNASGFEAEGMLSLLARVSPSDYAAGRIADGFLEPALEAVRAVPGVAAAGAISQLPYLEWGWNAWVRYDGMPEMPLTERPLIETRNVAPGFFETTGQRLLEGRLLEQRDNAADAPRVIVVNRALAERDFPGRSPLGQRLYFGETASEIVGVVSDIRNNGPEDAPLPEAYWTFGQRHPAATGYRIVVRAASGDATSIAASVERALRGVDPRVAISQVLPMPEVIASSLGRPRFLFALFGTLAVAALLLALAGLFGMLSYVVEQRRREYGLRAALGAAPARIVRDVLRGGGLLIAGSVVLGLVVAWFLTRVMESVLYGVNPRDPVVWAAATAAMALAGLVATFAPARRAGTAHPMVAMRGEP
ncbi:MAG: ABC transporter permease [Gemmatimonadaceae bacterium]|nr:ABC transporter permease [Gemmatimonadaceae bacterium]MCW5825794.1 ABC transporter permease [Gemmatimonadaceae bacterium]